MNANACAPFTFQYSLFPQCGPGYSCLKITKPAEVFNMYGEFVPPGKRRGGITVFRGCFILDLQQVGGYHQV